MWPVSYEQCLLSLKEKLLIEGFLRKEDHASALQILRDTWTWLMTYEPRNRDISQISENIQVLARWIKTGQYVGKIPDNQSIVSDRETEFWDFVCRFILGQHQFNTFSCESTEECEHFLKLYQENVPSVDHAMAKLKNNRLNLYNVYFRTRGLPEQ